MRFIWTIFCSILGRINRAERAKRRNVRLRKLLQPKNALMIINELVGHVSFEIAETKTDAFDDMYRASVSVEGKEYAGVGEWKYWLQIVNRKHNQVNFVQDLI